IFRIIIALRWFVMFATFVVATHAGAVSPETIRDLALGEGDARAAAIAAIVASGDPSALSLLQSMQDGDVKTGGDDRVYLIKGEEAVDLLTGKTVKPARTMWTTSSSTIGRE